MVNRKFIFLSILCLIIFIALSCANSDDPNDQGAEEDEIIDDRHPSEDLLYFGLFPEEAAPINDYLSHAPLSFNPTPPPFEARGIYVTANSAGIPSRIQTLAEYTINSGMNAMVIDVRTEREVPIRNWLGFADEWGISVNFIPDISGVLAMLDDMGIYTIARVVTFLDGYTVNHRPDLYIKNHDGSVWEGLMHNDGSRCPWLNPYNRESWDYVLQYAIGAAELGFKEIQFDYVRFAASIRLEELYFGETWGLTRSEIITAFLRYAVEQLRPYGVRVSADVYGTIINSDIDSRIVGQNYAELAKVIDVICPMVYPSHFAEGTFGIDHPDTRPYDIIHQVMLRSNERLTAIPTNSQQAAVRPWLQDFTASWITPHIIYGTEERLAQIRGANDAGVTEWLLWDPVNRYELKGAAMP